MFRSSGYFRATCHPWSCILFVVPLLLVYEVGLQVVGTGRPETWRNGADAWLRWGLANLGLPGTYGAPVALVGILVLWSFLRRGDRPMELVSVWTGMAIESGIFAFLLWGLSQGMWPIMDRLGNHPAPAGQITMAAPGSESPARPARGADPAVEQIISFIGAGIYEEALFRLLLFSALAWLLRLVDVPWLLSGLAATIVSALLFAAAHNLGPTGEPFDNYVFFFRTFAGIYFTFLYQFRGFGIAVGAHASYDVLVGALIKG